jgi:septal ring factor EnvC (AmiA/AmiB activator)
MVAGKLYGGYSENMRRTSFHRYLRGHGLVKEFLLAFLAVSCIFVSRALPDWLDIETADKAHGRARKERGAFEELLDLEEKLELTRRLVSGLASKETAVERKLRSEAKSLEEIRSKLGYHREGSHRRLRTIYKHGRIAHQTMILDASSPVDWASRIRLTRRILEEDQNLAKGIERRKVNLETNSQSLGESVTELSWLAEIKTEELRAYQRELQEREKLLKSIKSEKRLCVQAMGGLEERAAKIRRILGELQEKETHQRAEKSKGSGRFESLRGRLPWPVQGRVISAFGEEKHPLFGTRIENSGIEIETKAGTEIAAVAEGRVIYLSRLRGYGNLLILEHGNEYYTLYAHLSEFSVWPGSEVRRLQRIGVVGEGETGESPCLYFEIRKGKRPLDPLEWLK